MNMDFLKTHRIAVTPLSYIHIGTGEDYDPSSYVVRGHFLYQFAPGNVRLGSAREDFLNAVSTANYQAVNKTVRRYADLFIPWSDAVVRLDDGCLGGYRKMVEPQRNQKPTLMQLAKTAGMPVGGRVLPYIPGSSLKGAVATALRDRINAGRKVEQKQAKTMLGGFADSPLKFLKISDCVPADGAVKSRGCSASRFFKESGEDCGIAGGYAGYFESIDPGQYRAFLGDLVLTDGQSPDTVKNVYRDPLAVARDLSAYSREIWEKEKLMYSVADRPWTESVEQLLDALDEDLQSGRVCLVRIGKNAGAESKVLHGKGVAKIKIRHRDKKKRAEYLDHTTTAWFAGGRIANDKPVLSGLPFGWALIEIDPHGENGAIKNWCAERAGLDTLRGLDAVQEWNRVRTLRQQILEGKMPDMPTGKKPQGTGPKAASPASGKRPPVIAHVVKKPQPGNAAGKTLSSGKLGSLMEKWGARPEKSDKHRGE